MNAFDNSSSNSPSSTGGGTGYAIKSGDTLSGIAKQFNATVEAIAKQNNIQDINKINAGESLTICQ